MAFSYDLYKRLKQSKVFLANPQKSYIGLLSGIKNVRITPCFNTLSEIHFTIYEEENGEKNKYYDKIKEKRLIEVQYIGWFEIQEPNEKNDGLVAYKEVSCLSLENTLIGKKIHDVDGIFALYDVTDTEHSLMHIISKESGWGIGHIDNELLGKWRTFSIDSSQIYNLLTQDISKSFDCVFTFDTYQKQINAYKLSNIGELTDIVISYKNILKEYIRESSADTIVTKLKIVGADGVDIRAVNPSGTNYLINVDYFKVPISEDEGWMTQGLVDSLNNYQSVYNGYITQYSSILSTLKQYQSELTTLNSQLTDLDSQLKAEQGVQGTYITMYNGTPPVGSNEYNLYLASVNNINTIITNIANKKAEISVKQSQINSTQTALDDISFDLDMSKYFTQEQLAELNVFLTENEEYSDNTFTVTDTMTQEEIIDLKLELMNNGKNELQRASQPQYTIKITASNLFTIVDDNQGLSYDKWKEKLVVGNLVSIKLRDDYIITVRLMKMEIDLDNPQDIDLTFSNATRLDNELIQLGELQAQAGRTASALSLAKFGYDKASKLTNPVREFMNGTLNATLNKMINNDNQEIYMDSYGLHGRKWLPDQNKYDDSQVWLNNNTLLFTDDGWKSAKSGIGKFTNSSGETFYGVLADIIVGNFVLTSALTVSNQNNTIAMNKDGATFTNCNITINKGVNSLYLNATDGIKLTKNGVSQFYIDANGNAVFNGTLGANSINADIINTLNIVAGSVRSDWVYTGSLNASQITAGSISGDRISGGTITGIIFKTTGGSYTTTLSDGYIDTSYMNFSLIEGGTINCNTIGTYGNSSYVFINGELYAPRISTSDINGGSPVTFPLWTNEIEPSMTPVNIGFKGKNAATVTWCNDTFQPKASSDHRLKYEILSLDERFDNFFYNLKPKRYKFKPINDGSQDSPIDSDKIRIGLIAQQVKNNLINSGIEDDLAIIDTRQVRTYTNEGLYVNDDIMAIEYDELIALTIYEVQKLNNEICELKNKLRLYE